jgi:hypothetical protein
MSEKHGGPPKRTAPERSDSEGNDASWRASLQPDPDALQREDRQAASPVGMWIAVIVERYDFHFFSRSIK